MGKKKRKRQGRVNLQVGLLLKGSSCGVVVGTDVTYERGQNYKLYLNEGGIGRWGV